jgi:hypothetical protein
LKLSKISLTWVRISILSCSIIVVVLMGRGMLVKKLIPKVRGPALTSVEQQWDLEIDRTYTLCGHWDTVKQSYPSLKGLKNVVESNQNFKLKKAAGNRYVYEVSVVDYCLNCRNHQFLGVSDQNVAVMRGTPDLPGPLEEKIEIKTEDLPPQELEDLRKGIPFKTNNEKLQLIEGLKGLITN